MRKFVVSDLHGNGEVYDSIMAYLENISLIDDIELYINGDLIDRGPDSYRMLEDVMDRINNKKEFPIYYLGGNHELMMYQALLRRKLNKSVSPISDWLYNGGGVTRDAIASLKDDTKYEEAKEFLGELDIYHKFDELIQGNNILLVHAQAPKEVFDVCDMKIKDNNRNVRKAVWTREFDDFNMYHKLGKNGYFTIVGHSPILDKRGFLYKKRENYINIDGACAAYACEQFMYNHVPLVEIEDGKLTILIFNHNNEIIDGYYLDSELQRMEFCDLELKRIFIDEKYDGCGEKGIERIKQIRPSN